MCLPHGEGVEGEPPLGTFVDGGLPHGVADRPLWSASDGEGGAAADVGRDRFQAGDVHLWGLQIGRSDAAGLEPVDERKALADFFGQACVRVIVGLEEVLTADCVLGVGDLVDGGVESEAGGSLAVAAGNSALLEGDGGLKYARGPGWAGFGGLR